MVGEPIYTAAGEGNVGIGTDNPQSKLDVNGRISGFGVVPLGAIVAWHNNTGATPPLPDGWLECNGTVVDDPESPFQGVTLPNLNGERRFLRGSATSGQYELDAMQGHKHPINTNFGTELLGAVGGPFGSWGSTPQSRDPSDGNAYKAQLPITDGINGTPRTANETRPINMSVAWIMRVK